MAVQACRYPTAGTYFGSSLDCTTDSEVSRTSVAVWLHSGSVTWSDRGRMMCPYMGLVAAAVENPMKRHLLVSAACVLLAAGAAEAQNAPGHYVVLFALGKATLDSTAKTTIASAV